MADNPFTHLTDLDGQEFPDAQVVQDGRYEGGNQDKPVLDPAIDISRYNRKGDLGKISVIDTDYSEGYLEHGSSGDTHHFASFGSIQFDNLKDADGNRITLYIHAFSKNGMFLSTANDEYRESNGIWNWVGKPYFLGFNGVTDDDDDGTGKTYVGRGGTGDKFYEDPSVLTTVLCFAEGTRLATPNGWTAVETLAVGDPVLTAAGVARPVRWIGEMTARPAWHPWPQNVRPVRIAAHAFAPGQPARDLRLSPGHAVAVDGVLIPVGQLVNDATIVQEDVALVRYFHVELDTHDVLLAEGLPCESYLDDGNRAAFNGSAGAPAARIDPASWDRACAPLVNDGPQLLAVRDRLHARAAALGWVRREDAGLVVVTPDGATIAGRQSDDTRWRFDLPDGGRVVLRSRHAVLAHTMPGMDDRRRLGIALAALWVDGVPLDLADPAFGAGFYPVEDHGGARWRWTDGAAELTLPAGRAVTLALDVLMVAPAWHAPDDHPRAVA